MNRIKELRKEKGLTLDELSEKVGINRATLNRYENEKSEPKLDTWKKLADYFDVTVPYLQGMSPFRTTVTEFFDEDEFDENGSPTPEHISNIKKIVESHKIDDAARLSRHIKRITSDPEINKEIDNNISNFNDRLLISRLYEGITYGLGPLLFMNKGIGDNKDLLIEVAKQLDEINEKLIEASGFRNRMDQ
ncbi:helix-turn-helix domain-containing protein [Weissella cibaria]|uniref:helix-turn-helix domain-containing protein n=1 Tax=Weissella cibaria TaxID=137591 RepID=UPI00223AA462|nr:helix-turn-helix domain-containing protein [Weissella cibaria]MCT0021232.1 XRE family transcriptional regulator [Weissella cibaria]